LGRAFITAHIIARELGIESELEGTKELREIDCGLYTNMKKGDVKRECLKHKTDENFMCPEGESYIQFQKRVASFIKKLEKVPNNKTILIVPHSGTIKAIKCFLDSLDYRDYFKTRIPHNYIGKFIVNGGKLVRYERIKK